MQKLPWVTHLYDFLSYNIFIESSTNFYFLGMIDSGIGETQFNLLLSALNISPVSSNLMKRYERMVGNQVEKVAIESCSEYLEKEKNLTKEANDVVVDE